MRIVNLVENTPGAPGCLFEHGLSFYIETGKHRILSDTGASSAFLENARTLGIDLRKVDVCVLSHGHYDHAGGVLPFAALNPDARIYMQRGGGLDYYAIGSKGPRYIGIQREILSLPGLVLLDGDFRLDDEISLHTGITGRRRWSKSNLTLKRKVGEAFLQDDFSHEQALVVRQAGKLFLFSGCAHNGILNFLDRFRELYGRNPDMVFTGFHFMKKGDYTAEELEDIRATAEELSGMDTVFYSGHCTGEAAFAQMKEIMGDRLRELHSGTELEL